MKNIQITEKLFILLVRYHLLDDASWCDDIARELEYKLDNIATRDLYTKYKTALTKEEQEKARNEYLDKKGYHKDFRR